MSKNTVGNPCLIKREILESPDVSWVVIACGGGNPAKTAIQKIETVRDRQELHWLSDDEIFVAGQSGRAVFIGVRLAKQGRRTMLNRLARVFDGSPAKPVPDQPMREIYIGWDKPESATRLCDIVFLTLEDFESERKSPAMAGR